MQYTKYAALVLTAALLTACGDTKQDRALSGAGLGAGAGAIGGALVGGSPVTGAVIGGAAGAAAGALTNKDDVNLGDPAWR
jgi:osmotically inducible lipoprotein OsmB